MNLVNNAIKFTDEGSVLVVAKLLDSGERPMLQFHVRDTGIGIPPEKLESIFHPFVQADNSVTRKYGGTGLGLAISYRIAKSLGGDLTVESNVGHGSVFTVTVEAGDLTGVTITARPPVAVAGDVGRDAPGSASLDGLKILLVDDGETNRKLISLFLTRSGATVELAENGALALHAAEQSQFDVILMDMQMPVMDGYTATVRLRENGFSGPIIALTAHAMKGDREKCEAAGCSGYLAKPVNMDELVRTVRLAVGQVDDQHRGAARGGISASEDRRAGASPKISFDAAHRRPRDSRSRRRVRRQHQPAPGRDDSGSHVRRTSTSWRDSPTHSRARAERPATTASPNRPPASRSSPRRGSRPKSPMRSTRFATSKIW